MFNRIFYTLWAVLFVLCAAFGFIPEPQGAARISLTAMAVVFFMPPAVLVWQAWKTGALQTLRLIRNLCICSLILTLVMLIVTFATIPASLAVGDVMYYVLVVLSTPMVCGQSWIVSLCLWAALMWTCILMIHRPKAR